MADVVGDRSTIRSNNDVPKASDDMMMTVVVGVLLRREDICFFSGKLTGRGCSVFGSAGPETAHFLALLRLHSICDESM